MRVRIHFSHDSLCHFDRELNLVDSHNDLVAYITQFELPVTVELELSRKPSNGHPPTTFSEILHLYKLRSLGLVIFCLTPTSEVDGYLKANSYGLLLKENAPMSKLIRSAFGDELVSFLISSNAGARSADPAEGTVVPISLNIGVGASVDVLEQPSLAARLLTYLPNELVLPRLQVPHQHPLRAYCSC
ncbi:hypothetical protein LWI28_028191 [Acer negundo]|uniref:Uncharacterized protein n=1 Tax=Acer negundo TaxID=4023 RepID=A0AAD5JGB0_ACENE|nr:hypothetical protein LWI28_028191 [Acer negundo]